MRLIKFLPWWKKKFQTEDQLKGGTEDCLRISTVITHWKKLLYSDWLRHCEFIRNLRANSVVRGKLQISRGKSVTQSECKYKKN